jgi:hypothetical protein
MKLSKSKFILGITLAFVSLQTFLSALFGYFFTKSLAGKKPGEPGKIKSLIIEFRNWRIHLHHWFLGICFLFFNLHFQILPVNSFTLGFLGGVVFQGLTYPDWYKIVTKKSNYGSN